MLAHKRVMLIPDLYSTEPPHLVPGSEKVCSPNSTEDIVKGNPTEEQYSLTPKILPTLSLPSYCKQESTEFNHLHIIITIFQF